MTIYGNSLANRPSVPAIGTVYKTYDGSVDQTFTVEGWKNNPLQASATFEPDKYVAKTDVATATKPGIVSVGSGLDVDAAGQISVHVEPEPEPEPSAE